MEHNEGTQTVINDPIPNTPFRLIGNNTQGYAIAVGNKRLTEPVDTKEDALIVLGVVPWNLLVNVIVAITQTYEEIAKTEKERIRLSKMT